jgi:hypothetical protein
MRVRDVHTGMWWSVCIERWGDQRRAPLRIRVLGDDGYTWVQSEPGPHPVLVKQLALNTVVVLGGRRHEGQWLLCEADVEIPGWVSAPWPGPCERTYFGMGPLPKRASS